MVQKEVINTFNSSFTQSSSPSQPQVSQVSQISQLSHLSTTPTLDSSSSSSSSTKPPPNINPCQWEKLQELRERRLSLAKPKKKKKKKKKKKSNSNTSLSSRENDQEEENERSDSPDKVDMSYGGIHSENERKPMTFKTYEDLNPNIYDRSGRYEDPVCCLSLYD